MDEQLLIDGCMRGESWARKELYEQYAPAMMSVCMRYVGDRETARDLLQDGFVKIFTKIRSYSGSGAFGGWIRRIFVTTALEYLRSSENTRLSVGLDGYDDSLEDINYSVLDRLSADDLLGAESISIYVMNNAEQSRGLITTEDGLEYTVAVNYVALFY